MDAVAARLDVKLQAWQPDKAAQVGQYVAERIDLADQAALDILRSRVVEQDTLDMLDAPSTR